MMRGVKTDWFVGVFFVLLHIFSAFLLLCGFGNEDWDFFVEMCWLNDTEYRFFLESRSSVYPCSQ